jgi:ADP-ribose pyrophosphatase
MQLLAEQKIDNAASVIALQWLALNLDKVKQAWGG